MMTVELKMFGRKAEQVQVNTLREASQKCREFIESNARLVANLDI